MRRESKPSVLRAQRAQRPLPGLPSSADSQPQPFVRGVQCIVGRTASASLQNKVSLGENRGLSEKAEQVLGLLGISLRDDTLRPFMSWLRQPALFMPVPGY